MMLRIRSKISFMAFHKTMTIEELFLTTIIRTSENMDKIGMIFRNPEEHSYKGLTK